MPELPEVETIKRGLKPFLEGRRIVCLKLYRPDLRFPFPALFAERLSGGRIESVERRAKYLLIGLKSKKQESLCWLVHLGMSGRLQLYDMDYQRSKHDHVLVRLEEEKLLVYCDPRRFGFMDLFPSAQKETHPRLKKLGAEPLASDFPLEFFAESLRKRKGRIKAGLLDQRLIAGIGNIYCLEALWVAGISPFTRCDALTFSDIKKIYDALCVTLKRAIEAGGSSLRDYRQSDGAFGYFQHQWRCYGRAGEVCFFEGCGGIIIRKLDGGRSSFYCPDHQKTL